MKYLMLLVVSLAAAVACVTAKMGDSNLEAVNKLGELAVAADPANADLANKASQDAAALADSTGTTSQITHLGVPGDLADQNHENIVELISKLDGTKPEVKAAAQAALKTDGAITGRTHTYAAFKQAAHSTPWGDTAINALELFGAAVGSLYGLTRGQQHVRAKFFGAKRPPAAAEPVKKTAPGDIAA